MSNTYRFTATYRNLQFIAEATISPVPSMEGYKQVGPHVVPGNDIVYHGDDGTVINVTTVEVLEVKKFMRKGNSLLIVTVDGDKKTYNLGNAAVTYSLDEIVEAEEAEDDDDGEEAEEAEDDDA